MAYKSYVKKEKVHAVIRTSAERIEGVISKLPNNRLLDMLNHEGESFIPVLNACVFALPTGKLLFEAEFLAVNKKHVVVIAECPAPASE